MTTDQADRVIFRHELQELMHVTSESVRRWMRAGRLPEPDVAISRKTLGWRLSTLRAAVYGGLTVLIVVCIWRRRRDSTIEHLQWFICVCKT